MFSCVPGILFVGVSVFTGVVMYAYYENCDLLKSEIIEKPEQMVPYLVLEIFQDVPGMAGLFVAASISGTLRLVESTFDHVIVDLLVNNFLSKRNLAARNLVNILFNSFCHSRCLN